MATKRTFLGQWQAIGTGWVGLEGRADRSRIESSLLTKEIELTPHVLRHTALRKMAEKKGIRYAQQMAGHVSTKYIWRYVQPSRAEMEDAIDDLFD